MRISIITINLNNAEGLRKTIESVIAQTFTDFEYIVIDGRSTDNSVEVIANYELRISNFRWVSEKDNGIYNAMNKGILQAKGEYCLFLNSGDCLCDENVLCNVFKKAFNDDIVSGYVIGIKDNKSLPKYPPRHWSFRYLYYDNIPHQAEFIKRSLLIKLSGYNERYKILSDYDFNIKALMHNASYHFIDEAISYIDLYGISSDGQNSLILQQERKAIFFSNIPSGILCDYLIFIDKKTYMHPAISWLVKHKILFKVLKGIYKLFSVVM